MTTSEDSTERPVREQFKKASLDHGKKGSDSHISRSASPSEQEAAGDRSSSRKRSFEDDEAEIAQERNGAPSGRPHTRKRSRDSTAEVDETEVTKKRASDELVRDPVLEHSTARATTPDVQPSGEAQDPADLASPKTKRSRLQALESAKETDGAKLTPGKGFANTSATSPFGAALNKDQSQTSSSAFAASKFSTMSGATSAFGSLGKTSNGFGSGALSAAHEATNEPSSIVKNDASTKSVFGGSRGALSAFASNGTTSGFGKAAGSVGGFGGVSAFGGGSGFGSLASGPGLTSFASGKAAPVSKPSTSFGAPADDDDGEDVGDDDDGPDDSGVKSPLSVGTDEEKKDDRFYEQDLETGEEEEDVLFSCRAKVYTWVTSEDGKKEWKERGLGLLKLNRKKDLSEDGLIQLSTDASAESTAKPKQRQARFLMRADGSHRIVLNTPIKKELKVANATGGPPTSGYLLFLGTLDGRDKLEMLQIKTKQQHALELYNKVLDIQHEA